MLPDGRTAAATAAAPVVRIRCHRHHSFICWESATAAETTCTFIGRPRRGLQLVQQCLQQRPWWCSAAVPDLMPGQRRASRQPFQRFRWRHRIRRRRQLWNPISALSRLAGDSLQSTAGAAARPAWRGHRGTYHVRRSTSCAEQTGLLSSTRLETITVLELLKARQRWRTTAARARLTAWRHGRRCSFRRQLCQEESNARCVRSGQRGLIRPTCGLLLAPSSARTCPSRHCAKASWRLRS